ncbi:MAG: thiolase family protein [Acidimicrobiales bacterium]
MPEVFVLDAVRTPIGRYRGAYAGIRPDDLAAAAIRALVARHPGVDPVSIDDVVVGDANGAGEDNRNVARMAGLLAGLPVTVPGVTVNRLCGSGLEAVLQASRTVAIGDASMCIAGGVESMSRAPWVAIAKEDEPQPTTLGWRLVNPDMPARWRVALGEGAELLADRDGISRDDQDAFALASHRKARAAWDAGRFDDERAAVVGTLSRDEGIRPDTSLDALARLRTPFRPDGGTVTAGNSSPLSDGAAALLLGDEAAINRTGIQPLARIVARATTAVEPQWYGIAPVTAAEQALKRAGIGWGDLAAVELNEAFAAQALACLAQWPELDPAIVNPNGGAIAIGHPLGCSGARILSTLAWELRRRGGGYGLAAICIGVGQAVAAVLEAPSTTGGRSA